MRFLAFFLAFLVQATLPIPGTLGSVALTTGTFKRVRKSWQPKPSGSSRHFEGIEENEDRFFFFASGLFLAVTPSGKFGFCEGDSRSNAGEQNLLVELSP